MTTSPSEPAAGWPLVGVVVLAAALLVALAVFAGWSELELPVSRNPGAGPSSGGFEIDVSGGSLADVLNVLPIASAAHALLATASAIAGWPDRWAVSVVAAVLATCGVVAFGVVVSVEYPFHQLTTAFWVSLGAVSTTLCAVIFRAAARWGHSHRGISAT